MNYKNYKSILKALPFKKDDEWMRINIEMAVDDMLKEKLERWLSLLETDGIDSKNMVATDIQRLLEEIKKDDR